VKDFFKFSALAIMFVSATCVVGQTGRITGVVDIGVSRPPSILPSGSKNAAATNELLEYLKTVGSVNWTGLEAHGSIVYGSATDAAGYPATLSISKFGETRLDVERPEGPTSLRITGPIGRFKQTNGRVISLPLRNIAAGLIAFPRLLSPSFRANELLIADGGTVEVDGKSLHKISFQEKMGSGKLTTTTDRTYLVSDLYFGPDHLLYKSAAAVEALSQTRCQYLEVITYTDYRLVDGVKLPFHIAATLEGQPSWTFAMTTVSSSNPTGSAYTF
jgi:hypothetical protein